MIATTIKSNPSDYSERKNTDKKGKDGRNMILRTLGLGQKGGTVIFGMNIKKMNM